MTWLYIPSKTLPSVPASACSTKDCELDSNILDSTTALSLTSKGKLLQPRSLSRLWKRVPSIRRLSGLTLSPSTLAAGAENWIASLPDSHASRTASPASAPDSKMSAGYGLTSLESFAKANRGFAGSKTSQDLFQPAASNTSYLTLPASVSMSNAVLCQRPPLALGTNVSGSSYWPTVVANDDNKSPEAHMAMKQRMKGGARNTITSLQVLVQTQWMTPMVPNGGRAVSADLVASKGMTKDGEKRTVGLESQAKHWATPTARDFRSGYDDRERSAGKPLTNQVQDFSLPAPKTPDGSLSSPTSPTSRPRLNPAFACWLMGWPWWWTNPALTSFAQSEMALYRSRLQQHLCCLLGEPELSEVAA